MSQLGVYRGENGIPQVECPGCGEMISPDKNPILDSYDCPECDSPIHVSDMRRYERAMNKWRQERKDDYFDE